MREELRLKVRKFDLKADKLEREYKEKHKENFSEDSMKLYINRKLKTDIKDLIGDCSGLSGNLDACEITDKDRERVIDIKDLVED